MCAYYDLVIEVEFLGLITYQHKPSLVSKTPHLVDTGIVFYIHTHTHYYPPDNVSSTVVCLV